MSAIRIRDADDHSVKSTGTVYLSVEVKSQGYIVRFYSADKLGTDVILKCDLWDRQSKTSVHEEE